MRVAVGRVSGALVAAACLAACSEGAFPVEHTLREAFPAQAARVLDRGEGFQAGAGARGFTRAGAAGRLAVELPRDGAGDVVMRADGFEVHAREVGGGGAGAPAGRAVGYGRPGGASFWATAGAGVEEWILVEAGAAAGVPVAAWDIEGASPRQRGSAVDLVDASGAVRVVVTAPAAFAEGGRPIHAALEVHGARIELHVAPSAGAVLADPVWAVPSSVGPMEIPREDHVAVALPGGLVLVAGGTPDGTDAAALNVAEVYDPTLPNWPLGGFAPVASMTTPRRSAAASLFAGAPGTVVLVAGGTDGADLASAELYDPVAAAWSPAGVMSAARTGPTATPLGDGTVLVAGGSQGGAALKSVEIYDGSAWKTGPPMSVARSGHAATLLGDGTVLVTGGGAKSAEIYDPVKAAWSSAGAMSAARSGHTATLLGDGGVLVAGGTDGSSALASAEIYRKGAWSPAGAMGARREAHTATLLQDGTVIVAGGDDGATPLSSADRFDPGSATWEPAAAMNDAHSHATATRLGDGTVLVAGGVDVTGVQASAEVFALQPLASPCSGGGECASLHCAAGACCATECASLDPCSIADCAGGTCSISVVCDGTPCPSTDLCAGPAICLGGVCQVQSLKVCPPPDTCHDGVCDPETGACAAVARADGTPCDDGDACTRGDACKGGACLGGPAVVCVALDACHAAGTCDPKSGCDNPVVPGCGASPPSVFGASPDGALCAGDGDCAHGHCALGVCCDAACTEACFSCALPLSRGKCAPEPQGIDLKGNCGVGPNCESTCGGEGQCTGATKGTQCLPSRCIDDHRGLGPATCPAEGAACPVGEAVPFDCAPYVCEGPFGACTTTCRTVADCALGYACDATYHCARPPDVASGSDAGCQHAPGAPGATGRTPTPPAGGVVAVGLLLAAATARRARRRARAGIGS